MNSARVKPALLTVTGLDTKWHRYHQHVECLCFEMSFTVTLARYGLRSVDLLHEGSLRVCGVGDQTCSMFFGGQHTMRRVTPGALSSPSHAMPPWYSTAAWWSISEARATGFDFSNLHWWCFSLHEKGSFGTNTVQTGRDQSRNQPTWICNKMRSAVMGAAILGWLSHIIRSL